MAGASSEDVLIDLLQPTGKSRIILQGSVGLQELQ